MTAARERNGRRIDFFISYSVADERWATWIAWQLHRAGFTTLIQAWHFTPGVDWIQAMDRGIRESAAVLAVLSPNYLASANCEREWQATLATDPGKLVTVRIAETPLSGLLAAITYLDLVGADEDRARRLLLERLRHLPAAVPAAPDLPPLFPDAAGEAPPIEEPPTDDAGTAPPDAPTPPRGARVPRDAPGFPLGGDEAPAAREVLSVLHVPGPRFGRGVLEPDEPHDATGWRDRLWADVNELLDEGAPAPDLVVVTGDLAESGRPSEFAKALSFLTGLRALLSLESDRLVIVPGRHDVSKAASRSYFADCDAREVEAREPYHRKLEHYEWLFRQLYGERDEPVFDATQPWTLFPVESLRVVVAGFNSTWAMTHRADDDYGLLGQNQIAWFAERLREYERRGWLRIGALRHDPAPGSGADRDDPEILRDAASLVRRLGSRLNLVVHGPGPGGLEVERLDGGMLVVPAAGAGREELLAVTAAGLTRWTVHRPATRRRIEVEQPWTACGATFAPAGDAPAESTAEEPEDPGRPADPARLLLDRVAEVCRARFAPVTLRPVTDVEPPHLLVTRTEGDFHPQWRVAAYVGTPTAEVVGDFAAHLHTGSMEAPAELVYQAPERAPETVRDLASQHGIRLLSFTEFQGLPDLREYATGQTLRLREDPRYPPDLYVPQRFREPDRGGDAVRDDLIDELLTQVTADTGRFVLLLGDFGRGKTYAMREVARRLGETRNDVLSILIELRGLDKAHTVEGLLAAHLANFRERHIDLPGLRYLVREGRIVLLFDGFDELVTRVTYERATAHLDTLLAAFEGRAKIVVASRTQYFQSRAQVATALGARMDVLSHCRVLEIEPFTQAQIRRYLEGRYHGDTARAEERYRLMSGVEDLVGLAANPRMLSFIAGLDTERLRQVGRSGQTLTAAELYREILDAWLSHEAERIAGVAGSSGGLEVPDLWHAVTALALRLSDTGESHLRVAELEEFAATLTDLAGGRLSQAQAAHAVGAGTLLIRSEDGLFGFIHASVTEWLVAAAIAAEFAAGTTAPARLGTTALSQLTVDFLCDLADPAACHRWATGVLGSAEAGEAARANALKASARLLTTPVGSLRGADLSGQDLSYRRWSGVDLAGADLTEARLVAADLTGADLTGARLVGARLDDADLGRAVLHEVDATDASFAGADLTGASIRGGRWQRAALINTRTDPGLPGRPELLGAAAAPPMPVITEFAPAEIGVPHGFHPERGRLPQPLDFHPDGHTLAVGGKDGTVLLCDPRTGRMLRTVPGHAGRVFAVAYAPDGAVLATGAADGTVRLWDPRTGDCTHVLDRHREWPWPLVFTPGGDTLVTGDAAGTLRLWDVASGRLRAERETPYGIPYTIAVAPDGRTMASAHAHGTVRTWSLADASPVGEPVPGTGEPVYRLAYKPDGTLLAAGGPGGGVRLLDPVTLSPRLEPAAPGRAVYTIAWHPSQPRVATGDTSGVVRVWDSDTGEELRVCTGHRSVVYWVAYSPDGRLLVSGDAYGRLRVWDVATGVCTVHIEGHTGSVWPFRFAPGGDAIAVADDQHTVRLWDLRTGVERRLWSGHGRRVGWIRFSHDGDTVAAGGNDGAIRLWDPRTGRLVRRLTGTRDRLVVLDNAAFSPVRNRLATTGNDGRVNLLNLDSDAYERYVDAETPAIWAVEFGPDGNWLATAADDDTVRLWHRPTGRPGPVLRDHHGRVRSIAYHPGGSVLATGCDDGKVRLFDTASGELLDTLEEHGDRVYSVAFAPDGNLLCSAAWDGTAVVWSGRGEVRHRLAAHRGRLWTASFHPGGDLLATAGDDGLIRLWNPRTGAALGELRGHRRRVWSVVFGPRGDLLASGGDDGRLRLWRVGGDGLAPWLTLLGLPDGWAAIAEDGRYKTGGETGGQFWHTIGLRRFEPGELDPYALGVARLPEEAEF